MTARDRIVTALGTVTGLHAYKSEPDQMHPGAAWPVLRELNPAQGVLCDPYVYGRTYEVFAVLNGSYAGVAAAEAEDLIERLTAALEPLGEWVPPAQTVQIAFDNQTVVPGISVRVTLEPEE